MSRLFVRPLPRDVREFELEDFFGKFGRIKDVKPMQGYGFVEFYEQADADAALKDGNGQNFLGGYLVIEAAKPRGEPRSDRRGPGPQRVATHRLTLHNIPEDVSWQDVKDFVRSADVDPTYTDVSRNRDGSGVVDVVGADDMQRAIDLFKTKDLRGATITAEEDPRGAPPPPERGPPRDRFERGPPRGGDRYGDRYNGRGGDRYGGRGDDRYGGRGDRGDRGDRRDSRPSYGRDDDRRDSRPSSDRYSRDDDRRDSRPSSDRYGRDDDRRDSRPSSDRYGRDTPRDAPPSRDIPPPRDGPPRRDSEPPRDRYSDRYDRRDDRRDDYRRRDRSRSPARSYRDEKHDEEPSW